MKRMFFLIIIVIFCLVLYGFYIEPNNLEINENFVYSDKLPEGFDGLKVAHFSDLLYNNEEDLAKLENAVNKLNDLKPDIVVFTGDLVTKNINDEEKKKITSLLSKIETSLYKYAILGDEDNAIVQDIYLESNFIFLENTSTLLFNNDITPILIAGGNNLELENYTQDEEYNFTIVLIHKPDDFDNLILPENTFNLVLAGHSLGGEINIPFYGPLLKKDDANKYVIGLYEKDDASLYVNNGIGLKDKHLRLFNTPTINLYRIYKK